MEYERMLTKGALRSIMNNEKVNGPVFQVLGIRKISGARANERYRLLISDGQNLNSFAMLATQLNSMILSGELTEFAIVKINSYIISNLTDCTSKQVLILVDLVVIVAGDVLSKIGDPKPIIDNLGHNMVANRMSTPVNVTPTTNIENLLTKGALRAIMNNEKVNEPVFQVLGIRKISGARANERYRLLISDGQNLNSFTMLATQLNTMILSGELTEFAIVKINRYIISNLTDRTSKQVIILIDLDVIVSGDVLSKIGDPKPIVENSDVHEIAHILLTLQIDDLLQ